MNTKRILIFLFLPFFSLQLFAQKSGLSDEYTGVSLVFSPGVAYLYGDVAGSNGFSSTFDMQPRHTRYMIGGGVRHRLNTALSHKVAFAYGAFTASEKENTRLEFRGYATETQLLQFWWRPEFTVWRPQEGNGGLYIYTGIGFASSSSKMTGAPIRPTDRFKPSATAVMWPFGIGYEASLTSRISLGGEIACYYYYSDFIDGIQSVYSTSNDVVGAVLVSLSYNLSNNNKTSDGKVTYKRKRGIYDGWGR